MSAGQPNALQGQMRASRRFARSAFDASLRDRIWPNQSQTTRHDSLMPPNCIGKTLMRNTRRLRDNSRYRETPSVDASMAGVLQKASLLRTTTSQRHRKNFYVTTYFDCLKMLQLSLFEERVTDAANSIVKEHSSKLYNQPHTVATSWIARFLCRYNFFRQCLHVTGKEIKATRHLTVV